MSLDVPSTTFGSSSLEPATIFTDCFGESTTEQVAWFVIQPPTNTLITVSTCGSCYDTVLSIYGSSCDSLQCLVVNDDTNVPCTSTQCEFSFLVSSLSFCATEESYFILLQGFQGETGDFKIIVEQGATCNSPANNECSSAQEITNSLLPVVSTFSNEFANGGSHFCLGVEESSHSLWYKIPGDIGTFVAHTCEFGTDFPTAIAVFSGLVFKSLHITFLTICTVHVTHCSA